MTEIVLFSTFQIFEFWRKKMAPNVDFTIFKYLNFRAKKQQFFHFKHTFNFHAKSRLNVK